MNLPTSYARVASAAEALSAFKPPAISSYELAKMLFQLDLLSGADSSRANYDNLVKTIVELHLLSRLPPTDAYVLFGRTSPLPAEIICSIDPFAYVSHLSAMEHHGLTDRFPKVLYMTRPAGPAWRKSAEERMKKDLDGSYEEYVSLGLPLLKRQKLGKINKTVIHFEERSQLGAFRHISDTNLRVATIGRVFLDMIRESELCGGIQHVIDVYKNEARRYLKFIIEEIERHGKPIDKVRAGYLLTEVCKLQNPAIDQWASLAQRGGSRKLDPNEEFSPHHSERWQLSINVPSLISEPFEEE